MSGGSTQSIVVVIVTVLVIIRIILVMRTYRNLFNISGKRVRILCYKRILL